MNEEKAIKEIVKGMDKALGKNWRCNYSSPS
jgi:hypothetical protein